MVTLIASAYFSAYISMMYAYAFEKNARMKIDESIRCDHSICMKVAASSKNHSAQPITAENTICSTLNASGSEFFVKSADTTVYSDITAHAPNI